MLSQITRKMTPAFVSLFGLSFILNLFVFISPLYTMQIYDRVLTSRNGETLLMLSLIVLALFLAYAALEHFRSRALIQLGVWLDHELSSPAFDASLTSALHGNEGRHAQAIHDLEVLRGTLSGNLLPVLMDAPWIPIYLVLCFVLHPAIGYVSTIGAAAILSVAFLNERITKSALNRASEIGRQTNDRLSSSLRNAEVIKALGMGGALRDEWRTAHAHALVHHTKAADWGGTLLALTKLLRLALQGAVLGVGAYLAIHQEMAAGLMFAASLIMGRALAPIEGAVSQWKSFVSARSAFQRLSKTIKAQSSGKPMTLPRPAGPLVVDKLAVRASNSQPLLFHNVSFELQPGEIAAVVGPTGSGKSSLARALIGISSPSQGVVRLDGNDVRHFCDEQRSKVFGFLPQDVELFAGNVRDNINRFDPDAKDEATIAAASAAGVHSLIQELPAGYATHLGEAGSGLSGGQRQRIGLARALFGEPSLVVLDEPNSNLDIAGEAALNRALAGLKASDAIVVIVTHRLPLLSQVDKIIVMQKGGIVSIGRRDDILPLLFRPKEANLRPASSPQRDHHEPVAMTPRLKS